MVKINDTTAFPNTTPADDDHVIGTDISNTTNSADGETVTFTIGSITGSMKLITSADASGDSTLDFTGFDSSRYDAYLFILQNVIPATDNDNLSLRTSTDGGSNFDSGSSDYMYSSLSIGASSTPIGTYTTSDRIRLGTGTSVGSAAGEYGVSGQVLVCGPHLAEKTAITHTLNLGNASGGTSISTGAGTRDSTADVDAVRFFFSFGNIESGTINMYGLRNS
jgi:hypothetical protein